MGDDNVPQRSRINAFVDNIQSVKDKISSLSVSSLKSFGAPTNVSAMSEEKFVDYENMPLIGSTASIVGGEYRRNYRLESNQGFITRHRAKMAFTVLMLVIIYVIIAMFCGWNIGSCSN